MCNCNSQNIGRCWLKVDQIIYEQNVKRLLIGDKLAVYAFVTAEERRLYEKGNEMVRSKCEQITPDYCEQGNTFESEGQRTKALNALIS